MGFKPRIHTRDVTFVTRSQFSDKNHSRMPRLYIPTKEDCCSVPRQKIKNILGMTPVLKLAG